MELKQTSSSLPLLFLQFVLRPLLDATHVGFHAAVQSVSVDLEIGDIDTVEFLGLRRGEESDGRGVDAQIVDEVLEDGNVLVERRRAHLGSRTRNKTTIRFNPAGDRRLGGTRG